MKFTLLIMLLLFLVACDLQETLDSVDTGRSDVDDSKIEKPIRVIVKTEYTVNSKLQEYSDGTGNAVIYGGFRYANSSGTLVENAPSLKTCEFCDEIHLVVQEDADYPIEIIDYNYTHIVVDPEVNAKFENQDISLRSFTKGNESDRKVETQIRGTAGKQTRTVLPFGLDKEIHYGENSTTISLDVSGTFQNFSNCLETNGAGIPSSTFYWNPSDCFIPLRGEDPSLVQSDDDTYESVSVSSSNPSYVDHRFTMNLSSVISSKDDLLNVSVFWGGYRFSGDTSVDRNFCVNNITQDTQTCEIDLGDFTDSDANYDLALPNAFDDYINDSLIFQFGVVAIDAAGSTETRLDSDVFYVNVSYTIQSINITSPRENNQLSTSVSSAISISFNSTFGQLPDIENITIGDVTAAINTNPSCSNGTQEASAIQTEAECNANSSLGDVNWESGSQVVSQIHFTGFEADTTAPYDGWSDGGADVTSSTLRSTCTDSTCSGGGSSGSRSLEQQDDDATGVSSQTFDFSNVCDGSACDYILISFWLFQEAAIDTGEELDLKCDGTTIWSCYPDFNDDPADDSADCAGTGIENVWRFYTVNLSNPEFGSCTLDASTTLSFEPEYSSNTEESWLDGINITGYAGSPPSCTGSILCDSILNESWCQSAVEGLCFWDENKIDVSYDVTDGLTRVNVTVPDSCSGIEDLFVNVSYNGQFYNDTETAAINCGSGGACDCPSPAAHWGISEACDLTTYCDLTGFAVDVYTGGSLDIRNGGDLVADSCSIQPGATWALWPGGQKSCGN